MNARACLLCDFSSPHPQDDNLRHCRRECPSIIDAAGGARWPVVRAEDWCGDFVEEGAGAPSEVSALRQGKRRDA